MRYRQTHGTCIGSSQAVITWHPQSHLSSISQPLQVLKYLDHPHRVTTWRHNSHAKAEQSVVIDRAMREQGAPKNHEKYGKPFP